MRIDPISILLNKEEKLDKKFYFISGNETTLIEKVVDTIIECYEKNESIRVERIETISGHLNERGLFEDKKLYLGRGCKGIDKGGLEKIRDTENVFIFVQENSQKVKNIKKIFLKDKDSYLIDCYELDKGLKIKILNQFLNVRRKILPEDIFWYLVEKLENKYIFFENSLNKILDLNVKEISLKNVKKLLTIEDTSKEKIFFYLLKKNSEIVDIYKEKINNTSDVNEFFYLCKFYCQLIIDCKNEDEYRKKIPVYLFREKSFLIAVFQKYNPNKKKLLLNLLFYTEKILREKSEVSLALGLRFILNIKKITVS